MNPNTSSPSEPEARPAEALAGHDGPPVGLERLAAAVDQLLASDPNGLGDAALATEVVVLDRLEASSPPPSCTAWRSRTPAAPPAPNAASKLARPRAGCGPPPG
jgi:glutathione S-transferase